MWDWKVRCCCYCHHFFCRQSTIDRWNRPPWKKGTHIAPGSISWTMTHHCPSMSTSLYLRPCKRRPSDTRLCLLNHREVSCRGQALRSTSSRSAPCLWSGSSPLDCMRPSAAIHLLSQQEHPRCLHQDSTSYFLHRSKYRHHPPLQTACRSGR